MEVVVHKGKAIFLGIGRPGFDTDLGLRLFRESAALVEKLGCSVVRPDALVTDPEDVGRLAAEYRDQDADALLVQFSTFADGRFITRAASELDLPILIWSMPEPEVGGRLRLNSLTGGNLATSLLARLGRRFKFVYGLPNEADVERDLSRWLLAAVTARKLKESVIAEVGNPPPGFYTSSVDALALMRKTGVRLTRVDLQTVFQKAAQVPPERYAKVIEKDRSAVKGLDQLVTDHVVKSTQFYLALKDMLGEAKPAAIAVRCWPEFFTEYGGAACSTLSHFIEDGIPAGCEADTLGAVTMLIQHCLTGLATYLADLVYVDRGSNTCTFWHCGVGAFSLASERTGPVAGVQPNRNFGYALNNALRSGPVTIARLGQSPDGFRMLIFRGEALDTPNRFTGTSVDVRLEKPAQEVLDTVIYGGFEHHFSLVWKDIAAELVELCSLMDIPFVTL